jgi:hypothetical protein
MQEQLKSLGAAGVIAYGEQLQLAVTAPPLQPQLLPSCHSDRAIATLQPPRVVLVLVLLASQAACDGGWIDGL